MFGELWKQRADEGATDKLILGSYKYILAQLLTAKALLVHWLLVHIILTSSITQQLAAVGGVTTILLFSSLESMSWESL